MQIVEEYDYKGKHITITVDENPESPREWCHIGTIVYWHRHYHLGDVNGARKYGRLEDFYAEHNPKDIIELPVYLYDHSGITISTSPFSCPWDSGQVGIIYVTKADAKKEWGRKRMSKKLLQWVIESLEAEIRIFDTYLRGEVYCFSTENDGCGSIYELNQAKEMAEESVDYYIEKECEDSNTNSSE